MTNKEIQTPYMYVSLETLNCAYASENLAVFRGVSKILTPSIAMYAWVTNIRVSLPSTELNKLERNTVGSCRTAQS